MLLGMEVFSVTNLILFAVICSFLYVALNAFISYRKLCQFPGPLFAKFSRLWLFWHVINARADTAVSEALKKYGSPCRIGPDLLVTDDPDIVRHMSAPSSKWTRSGWYQGLKADPRLDSVFSTQDEKVHANLRAKEAGAYNGRGVNTIEPDLDNGLVEFVRLIKTKYNGVSMDFSRIAKYFTVDVLSSIAFGEPFGFIEASKDLWDYNRITSSLLVILELAGNHRFVRWLLSCGPVQAMTTPKETDKLGLGPALAIARKAVAERFGPDPVVKQDMLGYFVDRGMSKLQCEVEAYLQILAGNDSTTTVLTSVMFLLAGTPVAYQKLKDEIDGATQMGKISSPVVKYNEAVKLPYLQACILEGLRLYPPLFGLKGKIAPPGGEMVKGVYFPSGAEVGVSDAALCRRTDIFGHDSHVFRPERWIEASPDARIKYQQAVDCAFGTGRYQCLGKHIAMVELYKTVLELMRHFDWSMADPMRGIDTYSHQTHIRSNVNMIAMIRKG